MLRRGWLLFLIEIFIWKFIYSTLSGITKFQNTSSFRIPFFPIHGTKPRISTWFKAMEFVMYPNLFHVFSYCACVLSLPRGSKLLMADENFKTLLQVSKAIKKSTKKHTSLVSYESEVSPKNIASYIRNISSCNKISTGRSIRGWTQNMKTHLKTINGLYSICSTRPFMYASNF